MCFFKYRSHPPNKQCYLTYQLYTELTPKILSFVNLEGLGKWPSEISAFLCKEMSGIKSAKCIHPCAIILIEADVAEICI